MRVNEINSPGELTVDPDLIDRFTQAGWQIDGEGQDQLVMSKPGSNTVLKVVGSGSQPRQAEIRRYVNFFRANQRNPHFPRVGADRELAWKGRKYYTYTQERLQNLPGDEAVMDYLEYAMGELGHGQEPDLARVPKGLTVEDIEGLTAAVDHMFESGLGGQYGFDLANLANLMQRANGQLVIVDPFSGFDDELNEDPSEKAKAKQLQTISRPASTSDSDVKSFMSQGYTIKFHPDRLEIFYGGDLVYSRPGNYANPKRHDLSTAKARIPQLIRQRLGQTKTFEEEMNEVQILAKVKGKGSEPGQIPKYGRPIDADQETRYLGQQVGKVGRYQLWRDWLGGQLSYHVFDPQSRTVVLTTFGSRYHRNPNSYIIHGLYAAPGNPVKAHQFYRHLIQDQGLTLISDRKQSPGGNRVWQRLEAYPDIEVYGFDTKTGEVMNFGAADSEMYAVPPRAAKDRESKYIAKNIRLVATAR